MSSMKIPPSIAGTYRKPKQPAADQSPVVLTSDHDPTRERKRTRKDTYTDDEFWTAYNAQRETLGMPALKQHELTWTGRER
jgi:hypothetical protein